MSTSGSLLTPSQSAEIAGVSLDTINKYEEIGLLSRVEHDGTAYYREQDVRSLFFTKRSSVGEAPLNISKEVPEQVVTDAKGTTGLTEIPGLAGQIEVSGSIREIETSVSSDPLDPPPLTLTEILSTPAAHVNEPVKKSVNYGYSSSSKIASEQSPEAGSNIQNANESLTDTVSVAAAPQVTTNEPVVGALKSVEPIQEQTAPPAVNLENNLGNAVLCAENRSLREQVELLTSERDWLRKRVEQLETRSEREQMLLLSENETVRRLVDRSTRPRFSLPFRIPWFEDRNS